MSYYSVLMDGHEIFDPSRRETSLISAKVTSAAGEAGSFDFVFPCNHVFVNNLIPYGSTIEVYEDGDCIFYGRPTKPRTDIFGNKTVHCEGAIAFLNDIICPPGASGLSSSMTDAQYYQFIFNYYNSQQTRSDRKLTMGSVPTSSGDSHKRTWSFRSCMDELKSECLPYIGGLLLTSRSNGNTVINYISEYSETGNQPVRLGLNLLDLKGNGTEIYTSAIAKGGKDENGAEVQMLSPVYLDAATMLKYGNICKFLSYPEITTLAELQEKCIEFLYTQQYKNLVFDIEAVDIHSLGTSGYNAIKVGTILQLKVPTTDELVDAEVSKVEIELEKNIKHVMTGDAIPGITKTFVESRDKSGYNSRLKVRDIETDKIKTTTFDQLFVSNPETGALQSIKFNGTTIISTIIPSTISIADLSLDVGINIDFDNIDISVDGIDMSLTDFLNTYPDMTTNIADGATLTSADSTLTVSGNIEGYPYSASADTGIEDSEVFNAEGLYISRTENVAYNIGDSFDLSIYRAYFQYKDGTVGDVTNETTFNKYTGYVLNDVNDNMLIGTYSNGGQEYRATFCIFFDGVNIRSFEISILIKPIEYRVIQDGYYPSDRLFFKRKYYPDSYLRVHIGYAIANGVMYSDGVETVVSGSHTYVPSIADEMQLWYHYRYIKYSDKDMTQIKEIMEEETDDIDKEHLFHNFRDLGFFDDGDEFTDIDALVAGRTFYGKLGCYGWRCNGEREKYKYSGTRRLKASIEIESLSIQVR